jgi:hypothetical protein
LGVPYISEEYYKVKTEESSENGRADIIIYNKISDKHIIIENKIYAIDQWCQLSRYQDDYKNSTIVYLTLLGKKASNNSLNTKNKEKKLEEKDYLRLSYMDDIRQWLEQCINYLQNDNCKLKTLINDYLTVINELTYDKRRKNEILSLLSKNLDLVFKKSTEITRYKDTLINLKEYIVKEKFIKIILDKIIKFINDGLLLEINESKSIMQSGWGFQFFKTKWEKANIAIGFYFKKNNLEDCNFSVRMYNKKNDIPEYISHELKIRKTRSGYYLDKENKLGEYSNWDEDIFKEFMSDESTIEETPVYILIYNIIEEMCVEIDNAINKHKT